MFKHVDIDIEIDDRLKGILPDDDYVYLLGASLFVFNRFLQFMMDLLWHDPNAVKTWYELMDTPSKTIVNRLDAFICRTYGVKDKEKKEHAANELINLVERRNRIVHAFAVTDKGKQVLRTKTRHNLPDPEKRDQQFPVTREFMRDFISDVKDMDYKLNDFREYLRSHHLG